MRLNTLLLPHQVPAVDKMARTRVGALLMDMGTGKTRTLIEIVARRQARISRVIYFCPVNVRDTIHHELHKHIAEPLVYVFDDHTTQKTVPRDAFWYIVGIESMSQSARVILTVAALTDSRTMVVVDESTYIKNGRASRTEWITRIGEKARYRFLLTGTLLTQGIVDLYAQMRFLSPDILGYRSWYSFAANHLEYSDKYPGKIVRAHNTGYLAAKIAPYCYQVTKEECLTLPEKLTSSRWCSLTTPQRAAYEQAKNEILAEIDDYPDDWWHTATIYRLFTALQSIVCGFWHRRVWRNRKLAEDEHLTFAHTRLDALQSALDAIPPGEKTIVWTKFHFCVGEITRHLAHAFPDDVLETFTGAHTKVKRGEALERWRTGARFLIATPTCGGYGLTLTEAAYVVFYDNGFKYSERIQAEDRCHRIGQTRPVTYVDIACLNSIDERIQRALAEKSNLLQQFRGQVERVRGAKTRKQALQEMISDL